MSKTTLIILVTGLALPVLPMPTLAADAREERVRISDPALLDRLGFEPDATNVYATPRAYEELLMSPAEHAAAETATPEPEPESRAQFGTTSNGYSPVLGTEFFPNDNSGVYGTFGGTDRYCVDGGNPFFRAQIHALPHGARLRQVHAYLHHSAIGESAMVSAFRVCQPDGGGEPESTLLGSATVAFQIGFPDRHLIVAGSSSPLDEDIDLRSCGYTVQVRLNDAILPCTAGLALRIQKALGVWRRQVSPAPGTATFDDVPASHLFFQQIEALAASEITVGCDGNSFCPNAPLTRGQMAVFLAKALGLHWGAISQ